AWPSLPPLAFTALTWDSSFFESVVCFMDIAPIIFPCSFSCVRALACKKRAAMTAAAAVRFLGETNLDMVPPLPFPNSPQAEPDGRTANEIDDKSSSNLVFEEGRRVTPCGAVGVLWISQRGTFRPLRPSALPERSMTREEFSALALEHLEEIAAFAGRLTGNAADADDLVQATFERAFESWRDLRQAAACRAWLFRIARN